MTSESDRSSTPFRLLTEIRRNLAEVNQTCIEWEGGIDRDEEERVSHLIESAFESSLVLMEANRRVWDGLRRTTRLRRFDGFPVLVICSSQADHGARFERDVEKLGGRWVYDEAV